MDKLLAGFANYLKVNPYQAFIFMLAIMMSIVLIIWLLWSFRNRFEDPKRFVTVILLTVFSLFCVSLIAVRIPINGRMGLHFMIWNLFLAWIPYLISLTLKYTRRGKKIGFLSLFVLIIWLLFFPNAPYMITDFQYAGNYEHPLLWLNIVTLISFAWMGLLLAYLSLREVQMFLEKHLSQSWTWAIISISMVAASYGIFLGRYQRWDSWNILTQPVNLLTDILHTITTPRAIGMTLTLSAFLILGYLSLYVVGYQKFENRP